MRRAVKSLAAAFVAVLALVAPSSAARAQSAPEPPPSTTTPASPPPSVPPDLPTVATPTTVPPPDSEEPPPPPEPPLPDPSPQVAVVMAKLTLLNAQQVLQLAQAALAAASATETKMRSAHDAAQHDYDVKRAMLTDAVSNAYVRGTDVSGAAGGAANLSAEDYVPKASARLLVGTAIQRDHDDVQVATQHLQAADRALAQASARRSQAAVARDFAQQSFDDANETLRTAGRLTNTSDVSPSIMGQAVMTADEIAAWYRSEGVVGYVAGVDVPTLAGYYIDEGKAEHVRGDVAFAQSIVETGAFTSPLTTHNNYAGIGACDTCATGFDFPSPLLGVRAQIQLLHAYADKTVRAKTLANPPVGSDPDSLSVRGCCETWNALTGTWASDPNYGPKLMTVYLSMLQYTLVTRTQAANL